MKFLVFTFLLLSLFNQSSFADSTFVAPSYFFTYGDYSNKSYSTSNAVYLSTYLTDRITLVNHYEYLNINLRKDSTYQQHTLLGGAIVNFFPYYLKFFYSYKRGDFLIDNNKIYSDHTNIYSLEAIYYRDLFYLGLGYSFENAIGILNPNNLTHQQIHQVTGRIEYIVSPSLYLSLRPNYSALKDSRELYSVSGKLTYFPIISTSIKLYGFYGERAYYFDNDILTLFNQDETQKYQAGIQLDYYPSYYMMLSTGFQHTKFQSFSINYFVAGIRYGLFI